ncbi:hypothetical protein Vadar_005852 [Vaccinium darrowii]|uniref:Uncharacterized protein n=1 Tax=Vaccinium darrowii TaxID=229202 RepID=A0ACB7Z988_9ERIC|nr:hypothetical protein Vadar_005852 [Vaccinium darrowii]
MTIHSAVIQKLLSTNAHLGKRVAAHHFKIYTYGVRNDMTIIDSDKTLICIHNACHFISNFLCDEIVDQMTKRICCGADSSWNLGGFLTNSGSPKKFRQNKKLHLGSTQPPDCVVIMDTERKSSVIFEAEKLQIPIVGLVNSNTPWDVYKRITYPIPANDSVKFVYLFCNLITKTFLVEQKKVEERGTKLLRLTFLVEQKKVEGRGTKLLRLTKTENGGESENLKQSMMSSSKDEDLVIPYESLALTSDDPVETKQLLDKLAVIKLNGALGTKMGFSGPRFAIVVCNGVTYLDLIINQIESINSKHGCNVPLILMNTIRTHDGTMKAVEKFSQKNVYILPLCQSPSHQVRRGKDSDDELDLFDHRELFLSFKSSGTLESLLLQGKEYILVVKYDNLGALIDSKILNHLIQNRIQYCAELSEFVQMPGKHGKVKITAKPGVKLEIPDGVVLENMEISDPSDMFIFAAR